MKIAVIGGGSIGLLFSYYLNQKHDVVLYVRNQKQKDSLLRNGLVLRKKEKILKTEIQVRDISEWGSGDEVFSVVCVKQYHLDQLLADAQLPKEHSLVFVQNGMGHLKKIEQLENEQIYVASVEHGALKTADSEVSHTGEGVTRIALFRGEDRAIADELLRSYQEIFPFVAENDYYHMLVKKLVVNAVINPLTAVLKVPNGQLLDNPFYFEVFKRLFAEVKTILRLENEETYYNNLQQVCRNTANNRSSMLKDIEEHRPTEVDAILGYLIEVSAERKVSAPQITMLYNMIKGSELQKREE